MSLLAATFPSLLARRGGRAMRELVESAFEGNPWSIGFIVVLVGLAIVGFVVSNKPQPRQQSPGSGDGKAELEARIRQIAEKNGFTVRSVGPGRVQLVPKASATASKPSSDAAGC